MLSPSPAAGTNELQHPIPELHVLHPWVIHGEAPMVPRSATASAASPFESIAFQLNPCLHALPLARGSLSSFSPPRALSVTIPELPLGTDVDDLSES